MSVMKRMRDISVASLNEMLEGAEDPVKMIDRFLAAQRERMEASDRLYRQAMVHAESLRSQWMAAEAQKQKREGQAELAMKAGEEALARLALSEKMMYEEREEQYRELYTNAQSSIAELEEQLRQMRVDYDEVYSKRQYYAARMESIRLQMRMNERAAYGRGINGRVFDRLEDRLSGLEHEAKALQDVRRLTEQAMYRAGTAVGAALEREMEALKRKLEKEEQR
ncbi:PspA/IM30 family protein [Paenibacillus turpanensis]|uniref:PspA/IM30 family protein n=1 Tax=Paenibacillus turpanensis TaxID=2689078 RepID=UPI001409A1AF|nr:PspA/IM30 family protein [Paenibacillus turpanensis]